MLARVLLTKGKKISLKKNLTYEFYKKIFLKLELEMVEKI